MSEPVDWLPDGTPFSPRFGDRYRSEAGGLNQARGVFLEGCGLPQAWSNQAQWRVLETGFGLGLNFLVTWQAWKDDPQRPRLLHFVSTEAFPVSAADLVRAAAEHAHLLPLARQLQAQWAGLLPGFHRLAFEGGQVLLTLCIGDVKAQLKHHAFEADSVYLDGFSPQRNADIWDLHTLKAVSRCCRRGTRLATWTVARSVIDGLAQCGFEVFKTKGVAPKRDKLQATFNPRWEPRKPPSPDQPKPRSVSTCVVIGAGLAGAACAASLARRGWTVCVLDANAEAAGGASGLPVGLLAPHVSSDDSLISRLSRSGLRATWQTTRSTMREGQDWQASGVMQRRFDGSGALPVDWPESGRHWSQSCGPRDLWHAAGGWIKPGRLVQAMLQTPGISTRQGLAVDHLQQNTADQDGRWQVFDALGQCVAQADLVVLAAGFESAGLLSRSDIADPVRTSLQGKSKAQAESAARLPLQPVRGQIVWGEVPAGASMPNFPVNGHGSFVPAFPFASQDDKHQATEAPEKLAGRGERLHWLMGATFERGCPSSELKAPDEEALLARLQGLLPETAALLKPAFEEGRTRAWAGVRCASPDRLPLVGPIDDQNLPGLFVCTAMGSRGLTFSVLCGELLASWLHAEPLPLEKRLARSMLASRVTKRNSSELP
jgi:tRNA 5-methylaminomethyl-2-thiouridine biosynthesis bifunctional protein